MVAPGRQSRTPRGTCERTAYPEELSDPDIRDAAAVIRGKEKPEGVCPDTSGKDPWRMTKTEQRTAPGAEDGTESREEDADENANDQRSDPQTAESLEKDQKTPTETLRRAEHCRHDLGGAWLTQVQSYLRLKFLPEWIRGGSERE
ncbi:hypothetical protein NDU88_005489 [Pleurodeles waltl]|uniref:Uncharacterized protein n=1 Tax=Pleurodeles waltl TaxID=8319 RepID=A0AAV7N0Q6_PLEWA|nr:hypothetical protein NDU88_005489 [Pleurodeles waltl]